MFKFAFVAAFVYAVTIAARTARQATRRHGGTVNQLVHEVRYLIVIRAVLGLIFYVSLFAWLLRAQSPEVMRIPVAASVRWLAVALLVPVMAMYTAAFRAIGVNYRGGVGLYDEHQLVTTGPYRWIRHPIYASFMAIMLLLLPLSANWMLAASGLALVSTIALVRVPIEERELGDRFGTAWADYVRGTGRLLPRLR